MRKDTRLFWEAIGLPAAGCSTSQKAPALYGSADLSATTTSASTTVLPFVICEVSPDETYGYSENNPVRVGGGRSTGLRNQLRYLNALKCPQDQTITYERLGSCCEFRTRQGVIMVDNTALLDVYTVTWAGKATPVTLYINMHRGGRLLAPVGFTGAR